MFGFRNSPKKQIDIKLLFCIIPVSEGSVPLLSRNFVRLTIVSILAFVGSEPTVWGQDNSVNNLTIRPTAGSGHDYIQMLDEIVNPANGSVSIRIRIPAPPSRGFTLPLFIAYNSNGSLNLTDNGIGDASFAPTTLAFRYGSWEYTVPYLTAFPTTVSDPNNGDCPVQTGFLFSDPSGSKHMMGISSGDGSNACALVSFNSTGWDAYYRAKIPSVSQWPSPVDISDNAGNVYRIGLDDNCPSWTYAAWECGFPEYVEDRNGNKTYPSVNMATGEVTVQDSAHRTTASISGGTVNVTGLGTIDLGLGSVIENFNYDLGLNWTIREGPRCTAPSFIFQGSGSYSDVTTISLPNGTSYKLSYDPNYNLLSKITYPSGAYVKYTWGINQRSDAAAWGNSFGQNTCAIQFGSIALQRREVSFDGSTVALVQDFTYSTTWSAGHTAWTDKSTTVVTTDNIAHTTSETDYAYTFFTYGSAPNVPSYFSNQVPQEHTITYKDASGTVAETVTKQWDSSNPPQLQSQQIALANGSTSLTTYEHVPGREIVSGMTVQNWAASEPGSTLKKSVATYIEFDTPLNGQVFLPCKKTVSDGSTIAAETDYFYDGGTTLCGAPGMPSVAPVPNLPTGAHDEASYGITSGVPRGNLTKVVEKCFGCTDAITTYSYDVAGQVISKTDPGLHTTLYSYQDSFTDGPEPFQTDAYLTKITYPKTGNVDHIEAFSYAYSDGQLTESVDQNSHRTDYAYSDSLRRLTDTDVDGTALQHIDYSDAVPPSVTRTTYATPSPSIINTTHLDGLGHVIGTDLGSDPEGTTAQRPLTTASGGY